MTPQKASKSADPFQRDDTAVREWEDLLRSRPGDLAFVHELAMEVRSASQDTQLALATALVKQQQDILRRSEEQRAQRREGKEE